MNIDFLPNEILVKIFNYLRASDLFVVNCVCQKWRNAAAVVLEEKVTVMITDDVNPVVSSFANSFIHYRHWTFRNLDLKYKGSFESVWQTFASHLTSLELCNVEISERDLLALLLQCCNLQKLQLLRFSNIFMIGTFLEKTEDVLLLQKSLKNVSTLHLCSSRYLTDSILARLGSIVGPLKELRLASCHILFQRSIYKRFYPGGERGESSEHVLTFNSVLKFIERNSDTLKILDLSDTGVDNPSLERLGQLPGLALEAFEMVGCLQFSKDGLECLVRNQPSLQRLELGLCTRLSDEALSAIAKNLPRLKHLGIRRCVGLTRDGVDLIRHLPQLETLNVADLGNATGECLHDALVKQKRPMMRELNLACTVVGWKTIRDLPAVMPNLVKLDLSMCYQGVNDQSIQAICKTMVHLEELSLAGCHAVSDIGLSGHGLANRPDSLPDLSTSDLSLEALGIRDKNPFKVPLGCKAEQTIKQEAEVKAYLRTNVDQIISASHFGLSNLTKLRSLNLLGCIKVSDITLCYALHFEQLTYLNLSQCPQLSEDGLIEMCIRCPSLESLLLTRCAKTSDRVALVIVHRLRRIKTLDLQMCPLLTNDALDSLSSCRQLTYLDVSGCHRMTQAGVDIARGKMPQLRTFLHHGVKTDREEFDPPPQKVKAPTPPPLLSKLIKILSR